MNADFFQRFAEIRRFDRNARNADFPRRLHADFFERRCQIIRAKSAAHFPERRRENDGALARFAERDNRLADFLDLRQA